MKIVDKKIDNNKSNDLGSKTHEKTTLLVIFVTFSWVLLPKSLLLLLSIFVINLFMPLSTEA